MLNNKHWLFGFWSLTLILTGARVAAAQKPELFVQTGHTQSVTAIDFSPDGRLVATGSWDNTVKVWNVETRVELLSLEGHQDWVRVVKFSPDGNYVASGSSDRTVRIWDVRTGRQVATYMPLKGSIHSLSFSPNGKYLAVAGSWGTYKSTNYLKDGDSTIFVVDPATGNTIKKLNGLWSDVYDIAFSPDGTLLAAAGGKGEDAVTVWNVSKWNRKKTFAKRPINEAISSISFDPKGRTIASAGFREIILSDVESGREISRIASGKENTVFVSLSHDGRFLAAASEDGLLRIWDRIASKELIVIHDVDVQRRNHPNHGISFSEHGMMLAYSRKGNTVRFLDLNSFREIGALASQISSISAVSFGNGGRSVSVLASRSGTTPGEHSIVNWDLHSGQPLSEFRRKYPEGVSSNNFSPDGLIFAGPNNVRSVDLDLVDIVSGQAIKTFSGFSVERSDGAPNYVSSVTVSFDNFLLAAADADVNVKIWNIKTGKVIRDFKGSQIIKGTPVSNFVWHMAFSPDGTKLAAGKWNSTVEVWDVGAGVKVFDLATKDMFGFTSVDFSPDGKYIASGVNAFDHTVNIWNANNGSLVFTYKDHEGDILDVKFSPRSHFLASASTDKTVKIMDTQTGKTLRTLAGHPGSVDFVTFSPDERMLLTGSGGRLFLWDLSVDKLIGNLILTKKSGDWLFVCPNGIFDGTGDGWNQILWRFGSNASDMLPVETFFSEFYRPGVMAEAFAGKQIETQEDIARKDRRQPTLKVIVPDLSSNNSASPNTKIKIGAFEAPPDSSHSSGSGVKDVRLFRNGSLIKVWHGDVLPVGKSEVFLETTIPLTAGENNLTAYAFNRDNIKSLDASVKVTGAETLRRQGMMYILAVGINKYANPQYDLKYAVADAQAFASELQKQQARLNRFSSIEVIPLIDANATKSNILSALNILAGKKTGGIPATLQPLLGRLRQSQPEDVIVVYFAGHGTAQQNRFYLIPHDLGHKGSRTSLDNSALQGILSSSISDSELEVAFEQIDAQNLLLIIDACNSGQALEAEEKRRGPMNSKGLAQLAYEKGMYILTAAQSYQAALETPRHGHGYLTYALIEEGLKTANADVDPHDGQVTVREWLDFATLRVPQLQDEDAKLPKQNTPSLQEQTAQQKTRRTTPQQRGKRRSKRQQEQEANRERQLEREKAQATTQTPSEEKLLQQPRVFYRREVEPTPLVVARPN